MAGPRPTTFRYLALAAFAVSASGASACGGGTEATATERLWVSKVPTSPKDPLTAFLTTRTSDGKYLGAFFRGTLLRGGHDVFEWKTAGTDAADLTFLQDGEQAHLRFETCTPTRGFDYCLLVHGDPTGTNRYQSRKRWAVRRPGRGKDLGAAMIPGAMLDLAAEDEDVAAALGIDPQ